MGRERALTESVAPWNEGRSAFGNLRDRVRRDIERGLSLAPDADAPSYPSVAEAAQAVRARAAS